MHLCSNSLTTLTLLLRNTLLFGILPILFFSIGEYSLRQIPNEYTLKNTFYAQPTFQPSILILGNSHNYYGLNPALFDAPTFNGAHISQGLDIDYTLFHEKTKNLEKLEWVVINLSYGRPFNTLKNSGEKWRYKNYNLYYDLDLDYILSDYSEVLTNEAKTSYQKWATYYLEQEYHLDCDSLGFSANLNSPADSISFLKKSKEAAKRHTNKDWSNLSTNLSFIQAILGEAKQRNINVLLFLPPADSDYVKYLDKNQLQKNQALLKEFTSKNTNCFSLDLLENSRFTRNDYFDPDHLNATGAAKLTGLINAFINEHSKKN